VKLVSWCILAVSAAAAQAPRIGEIDAYGFRKVSQEKALRALNVKPGDPLPGSKGNLEDRLERIAGIVEARLQAVCCDEAGKAILFVGVEERGAPHFAFRSPPAGEASLPANIVEKYQKLLVAVENAARRGSTAEDLTEGHSLMADPDARELQQQFTPYARDNLKLLRDVLRSCPEPEQRAIAAGIIGYAPDKKAVLDDLQLAMQDPDEAVRANAMRALAAVAVLAVKQPALGIRIPATWFVEMLNSIVLSDRMKAAEVLVNLTDKNAPNVLQQIRERALPAVIEMARWKTLRYALPAYMLAGRMAGLSEQQIEDAWSQGRREDVIRRVER
jgi:hypothetical protein